MKIAYLICAHKNPNQLKRLLGALQQENVLFFVHIDAKSDESIFRDALKHTAAIFSKKRIRVNWGGFSQVEAWLTLLEEASAHKPDYYI
ncbi:MAG: beta-1,6-N-acetylglucosaminyltransferase, partial [Bacteroidia bacterium]